MDLNLDHNKSNVMILSHYGHDALTVIVLHTRSLHVCS